MKAALEPIVGREMVIRVSEEDAVVLRDFLNLVSVRLIEYIEKEQRIAMDIEKTYDVTDELWSVLSDALESND